MAANYDDHFMDLNLRPIKFRLGRSLVHAQSQPLDIFVPGVFRLGIEPQPWYGTVRKVVALLPSAVQNVFKKQWPGPFLPPWVVLKRQARQAHRQVFDNEVRAYEALQPLQGIFVPRFYGEATVMDEEDAPNDNVHPSPGGTYGGSASLGGSASFGPGPSLRQQYQPHALVTSLEQGVVVNEQTRPRLAVHRFTDLLQEAASALREFGMLFGELKLANLMLVEEGRNTEQGDGQGEGHDQEDDAEEDTDAPRRLRLMFIDLQWFWRPELETLHDYSRYLVEDYVLSYEDFMATDSFERLAWFRRFVRWEANVASARERAAERMRLAAAQEQSSTRTSLSSLTDFCLSFGRFDNYCPL